MLIIFAPLKQSQANINILNSVNWAEFVNASAAVLPVIQGAVAPTFNAAFLRTRGASRRRVQVKPKMLLPSATKTATLVVRKNVKSKINVSSSRI